MKKILGLLLLLASFAPKIGAQGIGYTITPPVPNGTLYVCKYVGPPMPTFPCVNFASVYTTAALTTPVTLPVAMGASGTTTFYGSAGQQFVVQIGVSGTLNQQFILSLPSNTPPGGGGTGNAQNTVGTAGPNPQFASYTLGITGSTIYARNNATGAIDSSGTDLRVVWDAVVAASPNGGRFYFKNGTYPCNSLDQESTGGFSNYYCVGIPGGGSSQYSQWILEGEAGAPIIDQFDSTPPQTNGVIFNLTATAVASVATHSKIMIIWARPDVVNGVGAMVFEKNFNLRVPDNQRGCETESDLSQALSVDYDNVAADTNVAEASLVFPVEDGSCASWGAADLGGLVGLTTTGSSKQENWMRRSFSQGADVGLDIQSEHTILEHSYAVRGNYGILYGVHGSTIYHASVWLGAGWGECARGLTLGANVGLGSALTIWGLDMEDATGSLFPSYVPVYHLKETNPGNTNGIVSFSLTVAGVGVSGIPNIFDGGGGTSFSVLQATSQHNIARSPAGDTFTRANAATLGPAWLAVVSGNTGMNITSNAAQLNSTGVKSSNQAFIGQAFGSNDQFSQLTVASIDSVSTTFAEVLTNMVPTTGAANTLSLYGYYCSHSATTGSGIFSNKLNVTSTLKSQTSAAGCNAGDGIRLLRLTRQSDGAALLYAFRNTGTGWLLDQNLGPYPIVDATSPVTGGNPGFDLSQDATAAITATNFIGGTPPTLIGSDSIYDNAAIFPTYNSAQNCLVNSASPAACGSAPAGAFVIPTTTTTYTVNTTAVTTNSVIVITPRTYTGGLPSAPTCVVPTITAEPVVSAIVAGTSFTLTETSTTGQTCWNYWIVN